MEPSRVLLVAERPGRSGGPAAWAHGLVAALARAGVDAVLVYASDGPSTARAAATLGEGAILHTYSQPPSSLAAARAARRAGAKVVHTIHGDVFAEAASKRGIKRLLWLPFNRRAFAGADALTVPSTYLRARLEAGEPSLVGRLTVIPNGIDAERIASCDPFDREADLEVPAGAFLVVSVTRFTHRAKAEGALALCHAVGELAANGVDVRALIAGDGPLRTEMEGVCKTQQVRFLGHVHDAGRLIATADAFVHATGLDVLPYAVLDALAAGRPALVSAVGGMPEAVGDAAIMVPPGDAAALSRGLRELATDEALRHRLSEAGRARAADFDWDHLVREKWLPLYREMLGGRAARVAAS
jgi:glycosyltransferase involved in cell wall biosynthesis